MPSHAAAHRGGIHPAPTLFATVGRILSPEDRAAVQAELDRVTAQLRTLAELRARAEAQLGRAFAPNAREGNLQIAQASLRSVLDTYDAVAGEAVAA